MGAFYTTYTLRGIDQRAVVVGLAGRKVFVSPERNGNVVVFDEDRYSRHRKAIAPLLERLSGNFLAPVLAVQNHDSDILRYQLYIDGKVADEYNSTPNYWSTMTRASSPEGGDAKVLCAAFKWGDSAEIEEILRASWKRYPDATDRHLDLVRALNLPGFAVASRFGTISEGYLPKGLSAEDLADASAIL